jgi:hypothetical protein
MTLQTRVATIADSISHLTITGITIKDVDEIPDSAEMLCPILFPNPDAFITEPVIEPVSFGSGGTKKVNLSYNLNYVYLHSLVGGTIGGMEAFSGLVTAIASIIAAIATNDEVTGAVDLTLKNIPDIGVVRDMANNEYNGALISIHILEYMET